MSKRLTDTEIWKKPWFFDLDEKTKLFWFYMLSDCDAAGIWTANWKIVEAYLGKLDRQKIIENLKEQITILDEGNYWLINDFIRFQYGFPLKESAPMFKKINTLLKQRKININTLYDTVCDTVCDTVKDEEEDKDKDIKGGAGGNFANRMILPFNELKTEIMGSESWIEQTTMHFHITKAKCTEWLRQFLEELKLTEDAAKPLQEVKSHFIHWYKKQPKESIAVYTAPIKKKPVLFPDHWDEDFSFTLTIEQEQQYIEHLALLGYKPKFNPAEKKLEFIKP